MTKTLTTRRVLPLLFSLVSAMLLFLLLAPTASAKTYTISGTGTKTKTLTIPKGYYQMALTWSNNGKEEISFDIAGTDYGSEYPFFGKKGKFLTSFFSIKKQKYEISVTAAKKGKWTITLKPLKTTTNLSFSGKDSKVAYVKVPKGTYKLSYTYSNNKPAGKSTFGVFFIDESLYAKIFQYDVSSTELDSDEAWEMFTESMMFGSKKSGKGSKTIVVEKDAYFHFEILSFITDDKTGAVKPNHNVKWSFKLEPVKSKRT